MFYFYFIKVQAFIACTLILLFCNTANTRRINTWVKHNLNADVYNPYVKTQDGGYVLGSSGYHSPERRLDFQLIRFDSIGNIEWNRFYTRDTNSVRADICKSVQEMPDGGYVLVGYSGGYLMLVRTDGMGNVVWTNYSDENSGIDDDLAIADNGDVIVVGGTSGYVLRYSDENNGEVIWTRGDKHYPSFFHMTRVIKSREGGFLLAGYAVNGFHAIKIDDEGEVEWMGTYDTEFADVCVSVIQTSDGGYCLGGTTSYERARGYMMLVKINSLGELEWIRYYDEYDNSPRKIMDIAETNDGGIISICNAAFAVRFDSFGEPLWRTIYYNLRLHVLDYRSTVIAFDDYSYFFGYFAGEVGATLVRTEPDTLVLPFELEPLKEITFEEVITETVVIDEIALYNYGRRYATFDSLWFSEEESLFAIEFDLPLRLDPLDTLVFSIGFAPTVEGEFSDTLHLRYQNGDHVSIPLYGTAIPNSVKSNYLFPTAFALHALYPNPFNSSTQIRFDLPSASEVSLNVFDINGRLLTNLVNGTVSAGSHAITWDASSFATGLYFVKMETGNGVKFIQKAVVLR